MQTNVGCHIDNPAYAHTECHWARWHWRIKFWWGHDQIPTPHYTSSFVIASQSHRLLLRSMLCQREEAARWRGAGGADWTVLKFKHVNLNRHGGEPVGRVRETAGRRRGLWLAKRYPATRAKFIPSVWPADFFHKLCTRSRVSSVTKEGICWEKFLMFNG